MVMKYGRHVNKKVTPQRRPIPGRGDQIENNAGGYVFGVDKWERLRRFLILGSDGGTYYVGEKALTIENARVVEACLKEHPIRTLKDIFEVSHEGKAPKNDPAVFALAIAAASSHPTARATALNALPGVCRIPTHLFQFIEAVRGMRGMGPALRKAIAKWYDRWDADKLAFELLKYQSRDGMSNRDVARLVHMKVKDPVKQAVWRWVVAKGEPTWMAERTVKRKTPKGERTDTYPAIDITKVKLPVIIDAMTEVHAVVDNIPLVVRLVREHGLVREMLPTRALTYAAVWDALLDKMPLHAMIRNLGNMSKVGLLTAGSDAAMKVITRLESGEELHRSRVHPIGILNALKTYASGRGLRGKGQWEAVPRVVDALDDAFRLAFDNIEPSGKKIVLALDVSGSMFGTPIAGMALNAAEVVAAMALVTHAKEPGAEIMAFSHKFIPLPITAKQRLDDVLKMMEQIGFGGTDCSLPMKWALGRKMVVDAFYTLTDNETWAGTQHPVQSLAEYRRKFNPKVRNVVAAVTATEFTVNDPLDPMGLDVAGFSTDTPQVVSEFLAGRI